MISIDHRTGSKELAPLFLDFGIQAKTTTLEYGDFAFEGHGPHGRCAIVLERKVISDLVQSIQSRRLSGHQLPGMAEAYDYCYLLVEGVWRPGNAGELQMGQGSMTADGTWGGSWIGTHGRQQLLYRSIDNYLATLELHAGVIYRRTLSPAETVHVIVDLYRWWNEKLWHEHSSHLGVYAPAVVKPGKGRLNLVRREPSLCEKWAMQLPHIDKRAQLVAEHFHTARAMANATEEEWVEIKGIGKPTAKQVIGEINAYL
jgi:ERCC4-type nuclease